MQVYAICLWIYILQMSRQPAISLRSSIQPRGRSRSWQASPLGAAGAVRRLYQALVDARVPYAGIQGEPDLAGVKLITALEELGIFSIWIPEFADYSSDGRVERLDLIRLVLQAWILGHGETQRVDHGSVERRRASPPWRVQTDIVAYAREGRQGRQVVRAIVVRTSTSGFEWLIAVGDDLIQIDALVKLFQQRYDLVVLTEKDVERAELVVVERAVVTGLSAPM